MELHSLLKRQLKKQYGDLDSVPEELSKLFETISETYRHYDEDRTLLERSLELSSEELYQANTEMRAVFKLFPDIFIRIDKTGRIVDFSSGSNNRLFSDKNKITGSNVFNVIPGELIQKFKDAVQEVQSSNSSSVYEIEIPTENKFEYYEASFLPLHGEEVLIFLRDIAERKNVEKILSESEEKFRKLSNSAQDSIIMIDNNGAISFWNKASVNIFGYQTDEAIGKDIHELIVLSNEKEIAKSRFDQFKDTGDGPVIGKVREVNALRKDGVIINAEVSVSAVLIGGKYSYVAILRDVTERKKAQNELELAKVSAERANRAKSEFLANMSHEIRTPMNAILGFAELLKSHIRDSKLIEYTNGILTGGKNLLNLINDILDLSKIEAGKLTITPEPVNPYKLFNELKQIFWVKVIEKGLQFNIDIDPSVPGGLFIDETRIRQVLLNLVGNAIKFTSYGSVTLSVKTSEKMSDGSVVDLIFEVKDTGIGIPHDQQSLIFDAFKQMEGQNTRKFGGTGLGLTITKRLVEIMEGSITLESKFGEGSTFRVHLYNLNVSALVENTEEDEDFNLDDYEFEKSTILLVEDVEYNRTLIKGFLDRFDISVIEAVNGREGVELCTLHKPDLVLMDIQMPEMDGYTAYTRIRENNDLNRIPVVAVTASVMNTDIARLKETFQGYLAKPVKGKLLIKELSRFLHLKSHDSESELSRLESLKSYHTDSDIAFTKNQELKDLLESEFLPLWFSVKSGMFIDDVVNFAVKVGAVAENFNSKPLLNYCSDLEFNASSFNIERMSQLFNQFPSILEKL